MFHIAFAKAPDLALMSGRGCVAATYHELPVGQFA